jgi:hypothetical protein
MEPSDGRQQPGSGGRHRAAVGPQPPARPAGGAHRAPVPAPGPEPAPVPEPTAAAGAGRSVADERAGDLARFLVAAREQSTALPGAARDRPGPAARRWLSRVGVVAVVAVAFVGLGAAVHGLREGSGSAPTPTLAGSNSAPPAGSAPVSGAPTPSTVTSSTGATPTPTPPPTPTLRPSRVSSGPPASSPPVKVREVPVVPVPATANGAAWAQVVTQLFAARSAAFQTGRPDLLMAADAPGSPLLRADRELYDAAIERAGFTRAEGLGFDLDEVRLLGATPTKARLAVAGRERRYVLTGPAGQRVVQAGPRRELNVDLTRSSVGARWMLSAGSVRSGV